jgi:ferric-dicitrate binding protein FerR (iron transport regulator)
MSDRLPRGAGGDELAALVRAAGRRPLPPAHVVAAAERAARARWQETVARARTARRRRVRAIAAGAGLLAAGVAALLLWPRGPLATVELVRGSAWVVEGSGRRPLSLGMRLPAGVTLATGDAGHAALRLAGGSSVRLAARTRVRVERGQLALSNGGVYVDRAPGQRPASPIVTPLGRVIERGTQFEVRLRGRLLIVRVREGVVDVEVDGALHRARAGEQLERTAASALHRAPIGSADAVWEWVLATAPPLRIDGRSPRQVLALFERESGLVARLPEGKAALDCLGEPLRSSLAPVELPAAMEVALAACGLVAERRGGALAVDEARP